MVNDILHTPPINPLMAGAGIANGVTSDMKNYGMTIAAMSQEAATLGMPLSSGIITAIMDDASDGTMNGMLGSTRSPWDGGMMGGGMMSSTVGTSDLANAMTTFINNVSVNKPGLTTMDKADSHYQIEWIKRNDPVGDCQSAESKT